MYYNLSAGWHQLAPNMNKMVDLKVHTDVYIVMQLQQCIATISSSIDVQCIKLLRVLF